MQPGTNSFLGTM